MTDIEIRALLGDVRAQEECTRKRILLPCWRCGGEAEVKQVSMVGRPLFAVSCKKHYCGAYGCAHRTEKKAILYWNTRPVPPIGRCKDCGNWRGKQGDEYAPCKDCDGVMEADNFCGNFEPKQKELATLQPLEGVGTKEGTVKNHAPGYPPQKVYCADCKNADNPGKCLLAGCKKPISTFCSGFESKENANG